MSKVFLIKTDDNQEYWSEKEPIFIDGFLTFETKSKKGLIAKRKIRKDRVTEITETETKDTGLESGE